MVKLDETIKFSSPEGENKFGLVTVQMKQKQKIMKE